MGFNLAFKELRKTEVRGLSLVLWSWWKTPEIFFVAY
jgi:hypothetical protein